MPEYSEPPILYPLYFFDGFLNWLKTSLENADWECKAWVESEAFDEWLEAWDGLDLQPAVWRVALLAVWNPVAQEPHKGPRRNVKRK